MCVTTVFIALLVSSRISLIYTVEHFLDHNTGDNYAICEKQTCLRKCCPENFILARGGCRRSNNTLTLRVFDGLTELNESVHFNVIHEKNCTGGINLRLSPKNFDIDIYYLQKDGSLYRPFHNDSFVSFAMFCMETFQLKNRTEIAPLVCFNPNEVVPEPEGVCSWGMIISMPFLLLTFIAYALLPDRNLHMKALMIYVINLMLGYLLLVIIQLSEIRFSDGVCTAMGYFCVFFFLVSFFWMNVICIDIWFAFSGLRGFSGSKKTAERKRFFMYCGYAFGMPVLHVLVVRLIDSSLAQNSDFKPGIGTGQCFLKRGFPELLYFYGPMAILITINIILFTITAFKIRSVKKETSMLKKEDSKRHSYENDKQTFNLYLKLLFAMGINWSMEIISWAVIWAGRAPDAIWYLTDFCNAIYGVFIFFIFVFKRSIWKLLKKRYYSFIGKTHLAHSLTMTNTTRVTSYSVTNSSVHENPHGVANDSSTLTSYA
ncbi:G-protein coupled receptor Mth2-like isoform X8 [Zophobas morio]|uniref:G-protein coupled receptor Mth2-like isoform X8 n=1 Tax=Zophobas morio TaxID=2755281 RepID=UPI003082BA4A